MSRASDGTKVTDPTASGYVAAASPRSDDRGQAEPLVPQEAPPMKAHDIPRISKDPEVSASKLKGIAAARTLVFGIMFGGVVAAMALLWRVSILEGVTENSITLGMHYCYDGGNGTSGVHFKSSGTNPHGFQTILQQTQIKVVKFLPSGDLAKKLGLQPVTFFQSEEFHATTRQRSMGFSFGLFRVNENHFRVEVEGDEAAVRRCIDRLAELDDLEADGAPAMQLFGKAIVQELEESGRREPKIWLMTVPPAHGALLLWQGPETLWSRTNGKFSEVYAPSPAWHAYEICGRVLRWALTFFLLAGGLLRAKRAWAEALEVWVVEYDYLWDLAGDTHHDRNAESHGPHIASAFPHRYQTCSLLFIFDQIIGDPQTNSEEFSKGLLSTVAQGGMLIIQCILPIVHGLFFVEFKVFAFVLVSIYSLSTFVFGAAYYFSMHPEMKAVLFKVHALSATSILFYEVSYLCSFLVFMMTRLIVDPKEVMGIVVGIGTAVVVGIVVLQKLMSFREQMEKQMRGTSSKGAIVQFLRESGLDFRSILISVIGLVALVLLVAAVCLFASELYLKSGVGGVDILTTAFTPIAGIVGTVQTLDKKKDEMGKAAAGAQNEVEKIL
mmetsp:Transcript_88743/g.286762  ORF Transcript_88743/g.286762 Transcript_88743/m.286762 type:complete len:610 (+) Transcript_88743:63-1892(+)